MSTDGRYFSDLVADAFIVYVPGATNQDIKLGYISNPSSNPVHGRFLFRDDTVALEAVDGVSSTFGAWTIVEWTTTTGGARLLLHTAEISKYTWPISPVEAFLVPHITQEVMPAVTKLIAVLDEVLEFEFDGVIELEAGFNVELTLPDPTGASLRGRNRIQIDVVPGAGLGKAPACEKDIRLLTLNGLPPDDNGDIRLDTEDCYRWEYPRLGETAPGVWELIPSTLLFFNQCEPCCQCGDYILVYDDLLRDVYTRAKTASVALYDARDSYVLLRTDMITEKACRERRWLEVRAFGHHGWTVSVQVIVNNDGPCDAENVVLEIDFTTVPTGELVQDTAILHNDDNQHQPIPIEGAWPTYAIDAGIDIRWTRKMVLSFEVYF
ncbi:MAG TPA: hypothetical protein ENH11_01710, partial [Candidatus Acetothermia bacterium]|nr:hypothetical protein [Candidatus Acetothermia bacterium]